MATADGSLSDHGIDRSDDYDVLGVIGALERICELESKLRQAVQQTHPLTTSLDWDFSAADREREALLAISEQVEYLEDKLREYRFVNQDNSEQKAMLLSQLDSSRRELLQVIEVNFPRIFFGKEVVRDVLAFAAAGDDTPRLLSSSVSPTERGPSSARTPKNKTERFLQSPSTLVGLVSPGGLNAARSYKNDLWEDEQASIAASIAAANDAPRPRRYAPSYTKSLQISNEDIYGPEPPAVGASRAHLINAPSSPTPVSGSDTGGNNFGGVLRIRDMLAKAEKGLSAVAEAQEQRRSMPPRIFGNGTEGSNGADDWETVTVGTADLTPREGSLSVAQDGSYWGGAADSERDAATPALSTGGWAIRAEPSLRGDGPLSLATPASAYDDYLSRSKNSGLPGLVGKFAGLAFVLGSIAAATMAVTGVLATPGGDKRRSSAKASVRGVDIPPWKDGSSNGSGSGASQQQRHRKNNKDSNRPKAQRLSSKSRSSSGQAPVMHVHQPPSSGSFPSNPPPDVTAAMG